MVLIEEKKRISARHYDVLGKRFTVWRTSVLTVITVNWLCGSKGIITFSLTADLTLRLTFVAAMFSLL